MEKNHVIKIKFFVAIIFLIVGFTLLFIDYKDDSNMSSYHLDKATVTVIDLAEKSNDFRTFLILGIVLISVGVLLTLHALLVNPSPSLSPTSSASSPTLRSKITKQEKKVVSLIELGKTNKEIAIELSISISTVKTHINNIFRKIGVNSRDELLQNLNNTGV